MNTVIIVCGTPGSGKTTYARRLSAARHATLLDIDIVTERLVRIALAESGHSRDDRDSEYFKLTFRDPIYDTLFDIARDNLAVQDVIVVGPFTSEIKNHDWPGELSKSLGCPVEVHYVQCPPDIRKQRLANRGDARDRAKLKDWENYVLYYGDESVPVFEHVLVDGANSTGL
ncbi:MAG: ATP-binding protein [Gammaproteobacteria bacterium]|jgi:predicted kinase|nr:ATP-binding protein [Gammaproteobacteria bacterium]